MFQEFIKYTQKLFETDVDIPLHEPKFIGNEKKYLQECIDSGYVSSVGPMVTKLEETLSRYFNRHVIACVNGTSALHVCLQLAGVTDDNEVLTQALSFVASSNAIKYCNANPVYIDIDKDTLGLSPDALSDFLKNYSYQKEGKCYNKINNKKISACLAVHVFGHPCRIDSIKQICDEHNISLIEDSAEALGSRYKNQLLGNFADISALSFNGNKIITGGGGGAILTKSCELAHRAKHLSTTAKVPHRYEYFHDELGFNYRLPNINAAVLLAQFEKLDSFIKNKRGLAAEYDSFFKTQNYADFFIEPKDSKSNYWLNSILLKDPQQKKIFLEETNNAGVATRPVWTLMTKLPMYQDCLNFNLTNSEDIESRLVNIPSSVRI
jgi:perosamine synthetase